MLGVDPLEPEVPEAPAEPDWPGWVVVVVCVPVIVAELGPVGEPPKCPLPWPSAYAGAVPASASATRTVASAPRTSRDERVMTGVPHLAGRDSASHARPTAGTNPDVVGVSRNGQPALPLILKL